MPAATVRVVMPRGVAGMGVATPTSTTSTSTPSAAARTQTAAPPAAKLATIAAVTSRGQAETPASTTP